MRQARDTPGNFDVVFEIEEGRSRRFHSLVKIAVGRHILYRRSHLKGDFRHLPFF